MSRQKSCLGRIARQNNAFPHRIFSKCRSHTLASKAAIGFFVSPATLFEFRCWRIRFSFPPAAAAVCLCNSIFLAWLHALWRQLRTSGGPSRRRTHTHTHMCFPPSLFYLAFLGYPLSSFYAAPPTPPLASARIKNPLSPPTTATAFSLAHKTLLEEGKRNLLLSPSSSLKGGGGKGGQRQLR